MKAKFFFQRLDAPKISMTDVMVKPGSVAIINCTIVGFPYSNVLLTFTPCVNDIVCSTEERILVKLNVRFQSRHTRFIISMITIMQTSMVQTKFSNSVFISFIPKSSGFLTCYARNAIDNPRATANVIISDLKEDMVVWNENKHSFQNFNYLNVLSCAGSIYKYSKVDWFHGGRPIVEDSKGK